MSNLNEGFNERPIDPPESFEMGGDPDATHERQRAVISNDLSHFFQPHTPSEVVYLVNHAARLRHNNASHVASIVMGRALNLLIEAHAEQSEVTEIGE